MPKFDISYSDLVSLTGKKITVEELKEFVQLAKAEIDSVDGDVIKIDSGDTNRPDLWSSEGIAREIRGRIANESGVPRYRIGKSDIVVKVEKKVSKVRPYTVCAVARNLKLNETILSQMIQLQEKVAGSFGRNRKEVAIGVYDLEKIKSPIKYTTVKPDGIKFVPLDFQDEMTPEEVLKTHPKGKEFGYLLDGKKEYPIFIDSAGEVLSLPPIINSNNTGKVTVDTKNVFIECTGFNLRFLIPALNVITSALMERNAKIESVKIKYGSKILETPDFKPKKTRVSTDFIKRISGLNLKNSEIIDYLEMARYDAKLRGKIIELEYPAYRQDIMHPRDVVEDLIISYGINKIEPQVIRGRTEGETSELEIFSNRAAQIIKNLGFQEIISYTLTKKQNLFERMNLKEEKVIELENPVSNNWNVFRNWLIPSLIEFCSNNQNVEFPQRMFEIGDVIILNEKMETRTEDVRKLSVAISDSVVRFSEMAYILGEFMSKMKVRYKLKRTKHPSFIEGRVAEILVKNKKIGFIGEINPEVLESWNLSMPVAAFELNLRELMK